MVGAVQVAGSSTPERLCEYQHKDEEKDTDNFEEKDIPHPAEWLEKAAHASRQSPGGPAGAAARHSDGWRFIRGIDGHGVRYWRAGGIARCCLGRIADETLPCHAACHTNANPQHPANGLRFHTRL